MNNLTKFLEPDLETWLETRIADGEFVDVEDYLRALVRRDWEEAREETAWLREQIDIGRASGIIDNEPEEVIEEIIAERRARSVSA